MQSILKRDAAAAAIFSVLTLVMTNPLALHLASAVEDKQDALLNTWIIAWVGHALITDPLNLFNANIFYPYPNALAFSETMLPQGIFALPFNLALDNTVLGYNLVLLASFFIAAYAMYLFVFDLTRRRAAAIIAGIIFAFNPYNLGNLAQVQLLSFGWLPLALLYLKRVLRGKGSRHKEEGGSRNFIFQISDFRFSFLFGLFFSLQALSSFYYAFLAGIAAVLYIFWNIIANRSTFDPPLWRAIAPPLVRLTISFLLITLLVSPFFQPYLQVQRDLGFERKVEESEPFSASLKLYTEVSPQNVVYGKWLAPQQLIYHGGYPLDNLFPGLIAVALAVIGVAATKNRERWFYFLLLALAFLLSLGPRLYFTPTQPTELTLPYHWLYDLFPLMRALRAPVRFDALVMFTMAVLGGMGSFKIQNSKFKIANHESRITNVLIPLIALEYLALPAAQITPVLVGDAIPDYVRWLRMQPPGVVFELPMIASDPSKPLELTTQYLSTYHWHPTPDGYSGFNPPRRGEIAYEMGSFPGQRAVSLLQALDVQYVIIHGDEIRDLNSLRLMITRVGDLQLVRNYDDDYIYRVLPRARDALALAASAYLPNPAAVNQTFVAYVIVQNRTPSTIFAIKPTDTLQVDAHWSDDTTRIGQHTTAVMPLVTPQVSVVPVRVMPPPRPGIYRLELRISSHAIGTWNLSGNVSVETGEPAHQIVLPARVALNSRLNASYAPGETLDLFLFWFPLNKIDAYYSVSVRVVDSRGNKIIAEDRQPSTPTLLWSPYLDPSFDRFALTLPGDIAPGEYSVQLLMYQAEQGTEALLLDDKFNPQETFVLGKFMVK